MKRTYRNLLTCLAVTAVFSFTGCFDPVFYEINQDVTPEKALVSGAINSIARYTVNGGEYIALAGGNSSTKSKAKGLLYKPAESEKHGEWITYPQKHTENNIEKGLPFELHYYDYYGDQNHKGQQIIKVLSGTDYLYLVTAEYENNASEGTNVPKWIHLWAAKMLDEDNDGIWDDLPASAWTDLNPAGQDSDTYFPIVMESGYAVSNFNVFSTNSTIAANRTVYIRKGTLNSASYYKLSGTTITPCTILDCINGDESVSLSSNKYNVNAVANVNGSELFFTNPAVTTNETYSTPATKFYYGTGKSIYYGSSAADLNLIITTNSYIMSMAYCQDAILIGSAGSSGYAQNTSTANGGIEKIQLTDDIPENKLGTFTTNAQSQLLPSYIVPVVLNATPDKTELESSLYATLDFLGTASSTTASYNNKGLWSYYAKRGNWNRE